MRYLIGYTIKLRNYMKFENSNSTGDINETWPVESLETGMPLSTDPFLAWWFSTVDIISPILACE